jgi:hypothetical protein
MILILFCVVERADLQKGSRRKRVLFNRGHRLCVADLFFMFILEAARDSEEKKEESHEGSCETEGGTLKEESCGLFLPTPRASQVA